MDESRLTSSNPLQTVSDSETWNNTNLDVPNGSTYCSEPAAMTDVTNPRHMTSLSFENASSSSKPNSTPPSGLPNATDTPAAAAAASSLRFWAAHFVRAGQDKATRQPSYLHSVGIDETRGKEGMPSSTLRGRAGLPFPTKARKRPRVRGRRP